MSEWRGLHNPELHTPWTITVSGHEWSDCANGYPDAQYPDFDGGYQTACEDILRALDGGAE